MCEEMTQYVIKVFNTITSQKAYDEYIKSLVHVASHPPSTTTTTSPPSHQSDEDVREQKKRQKEHNILKFDTTLILMYDLLEQKILVLQQNLDAKYAQFVAERRESRTPKSSGKTGAVMALIGEPTAAQERGLDTDHDKHNEQNEHGEHDDEMKVLFFSQPLMSQALENVAFMYKYQHALQAYITLYQDKNKKLLMQLGRTFLQDEENNNNNNNINGGDGHNQNFKISLAPQSSPSPLTPSQHSQPPHGKQYFLCFDNQVGSTYNTI